jgi:hypothetical protein
MKRSELEEAIVAATEIIRQREVLIIGSQAILGTFDEDSLPPSTTMSVEVDMAPLRDDAAETVANILDGALGEWSPFDEAHGFYVQGVSVKTAYLPDGWAGRTVAVIPPGHPDTTGRCLERHDLCAAKLARGDEKDRGFVDDLAAVGLVDPAIVLDRILSITDPRFETTRKAIAVRWIKHRIRQRE